MTTIYFTQLLETQAQVELLEEERKRLINDLAEQKVACSFLCIDHYQVGKFLFSLYTCLFT